MRTIERVGLIWDNFSTSLGLEPVEPIGEYDIHPRGGDKRVDILTPEGMTLTVFEGDVIHVKGDNGFARFTSRDLPPGYTFI